MTADVIVRSFDRTDPRLGRHQVHDERSRAFALEAIELPKREVLHERRCPIFDQGNVGSCTGNAGLGMLAALPSSAPVIARLGGLSVDPATWTEPDAVELYHEETILDDSEIPGQYPPDDTGSAGIYIGKVLRNRGWVASYRHAFSLTTTLAWLGRQPVALGIPWLNSMFEPGPHGLVTVDRRSGVAGGHEIALTGIDPVHSLVRFDQSWGAGWGDSGHGWLRYADLGWLLGQGGDVITVF